MTREIKYDDFDNLMKLYTQLHNNVFPENNKNIIEVWNKIISDNNYHIIVVEENNKIISSCTCIIISNLTHNQQSYAIIENVITDSDFRNKGYATKCLNFAKDIAIKEKCYKIMLMTGSKKESTLNFYEKAGFNRKDKTAFIQWI